MEFNYKKFKSEYDVNYIDCHPLYRETLLNIANLVNDNNDFHYEYLKLLDSRFEKFIENFFIPKLNQMVFEEHKIKLIDNVINVTLFYLSSDPYLYNNDNPEEMDYITYTLKDSFIGWQNDGLLRQNVIDFIKVRTLKFIAAIEQIKKNVINKVKDSNSGHATVVEPGNDNLDYELKKYTHRLILLYKTGAFDFLYQEYKIDNENGLTSFAKLLAAILNVPNESFRGFAGEVGKLRTFGESQISKAAGREAESVLTKIGLAK